MNSARRHEDHEAVDGKGDRSLRFGYRERTALGKRGYRGVDCAVWIVFAVAVLLLLGAIFLSAWSSEGQVVEGWAPAPGGPFTNGVRTNLWGQGYGRIWGIDNASNQWSSLGYWLSNSWPRPFLSNGTVYGTLPALSSNDAASLAKGTGFNYNVTILPVK
jgi:hypothetical protein